jgi:hypothetical protein
MRLGTQSVDALGKRDRAYYDEQVTQNADAGFRRVDERATNWLADRVADLYQLSRAAILADANRHDVNLQQALGDEIERLSVLYAADPDVRALEAYAAPAWADTLDRMRDAIECEAQS